MRRMTAEEIDAYVSSGEALGKAGAYALQETGDRYVEQMDGSPTNVVGLPMELLERMLKAAGYDPRDLRE
jgi:septum formation protein